MIPSLPSAFVSVLLRHLKSNYLARGGSNSPWNRRDTEYFAKGIVRLNRGFTTGRGGRAADYFNDPVLRSGYLAYFLPVNAVKASAILDDCFHAPLAGRLRVADIGAGPLTLTLALVFHLAKRLEREAGDGTISLDVDAFERNGKILADGRRLVFAYLEAAGLGRKIALSLNARPAPFSAGFRMAGTYDLLLFGNVLNEWDLREDQRGLVLPLLARHARPGSAVLFLEPGSKKSARDLQALRDAIVQNSDFRVIAPCLHQHTCPLNLTAKSDWCHFTRRWEAPDFIRDFDECARMKKTRLLYSYLLMSREPATIHPRDAFVAITDLMREKGREELIGCGPAGRVRFVRAHRDESAENRDFSLLHRGDRFRVAGFGCHEPFTLEKRATIRPAGLRFRHWGRAGR